jgi:hypothetical protein
MTLGDSYRSRAAEFSAKARAETNAELRIEFATLARSYLRLAKQADLNSVPSDIVYETPDRPGLDGARG